MCLVDASFFYTISVAEDGQNFRAFVHRMDKPLYLLKNLFQGHGVAFFEEGVVAGLGGELDGGFSFDTM